MLGSFRFGELIGPSIFTKTLPSAEHHSSA